MKMKNTISMLATAASMLSAGMAKSEANVMDGVFKAPVDQILSASDKTIVTYRSGAKVSYEKDGVTVTNYYPTVSENANGTSGFAFQGPAPVGSSLIVNEKTGEFVYGSQGQSGQIQVGTLNPDADPLKAISTKTYTLLSNQQEGDVHNMDDVTGYKYDDKIILWGKAGVGGKKSETVRAVLTGENEFTVQKSDVVRGAAYVPTMAVDTDSNVFASNGTDVTAFSKDSNITTATKIVENATIVGMTVVDGVMNYATPDAVYDENGNQVSSVGGITGLAKSGSTLYVGTTNATTKAASPLKTASRGAAAPVVVEDAKKIISGKDNTIWKLTMANELVRVR